MSHLEKLRSLVADWKAKHRKRRLKTLRHAIQQLKALAHEDGKTEEEEACKKREAFDAGEKKWTAWKGLLASHRKCDRQVRVYAELQRQVELAEGMKLKPDEMAEFLKCVPAEVKDRDLGVVKESVRKGSKAWKQARHEVENCMPDVFLAHSFLQVSDLSRVEVATLFSAALVWFGMVYSQLFYLGATGASVLRYVTVEDFLDEGVRGLIRLGLLLIFAEVAFLLVRLYVVRSARKSHKWGYRLHHAVVNHPVRIAAWAFAITTISMAAMGATHGSYRRLEAFDTPAAVLETATVVGGTTLEDVYLVGTTSRTATFLQVCDWTRDRLYGTPGKVRALRGELRSLAVAAWRLPGRSWGLLRGHTDDTVVSGDGNGLPQLELCDWTPGRASQVRRAGSARVLTMDRALVICHSKGDSCVELMKTGDATQTDGELDPYEPATPALLQDQFKQIEDLLSDQLDGIDRHLDRHRCQILQHIGDAAVAEGCPTAVP